jgi:hypothetical protein
MSLRWIAILILLCGCSREVSHMSEPENPGGQYREQIAVAKKVLEQNENWADRAEWEVQKSGDGWKLIAWRVEHPEAKGAARYLPWGYSVIELDRRTVAVGYARKG